LPARREGEPVPGLRAEDALCGTCATPRRTSRPPTFPIAE
jgi:hypothetical protein